MSKRPYLQNWVWTYIYPKFHVETIECILFDNLKKLDKKLKDLSYPWIEAIKAKFQLYKGNGSGLRESSINCVIILKNTHRFKDDPEYGEMWTRFWRDNLTQEDRDKINTRVVGRDGVTLSTFDKDVVYTCSTNKKSAMVSKLEYFVIISTHPKTVVLSCHLTSYILAEMQIVSQYWLKVYILILH